MTENRELNNEYLKSISGGRTEEKRVARLNDNQCIHCQNCLSVCQTNAVYEEFDESTHEDVIRINPDKCSGCGECERICPTLRIEMVSK